MGPLRPLDFAVGGSTAAEVRRFRGILRRARGRALLDPRENLVEHLPGRAGQFLVQASGRIHFRNGNPLLGDDVACVWCSRHMVQSDPGFRLAVDQDPVDGAPSAILGQEGPVQVEAASRRDVEDRGLDHAAIVEREQDIRRHLLDSTDP